MKVLLATSPHVKHAAVLQSDFAPRPDAMYCFAPVGLLSLAAVLRRERPEVTCEIYDLNRRIIAGALPLNSSFYSAAAQDICSRAPDVVGFMTECDSYHHVLQIAAAIKLISSRCVVVLGGPHATEVARQTLARCAAIDAIVLGEGEITFVELLDALREPRSVAVPGAVQRHRVFGVVAGGPRMLVESLDDLPIPAYDLYRPDPGEEIFLEVGRGCPFQCKFCSTAPYWKRRHRVKSAERVLQEVRHVRELFGTTRAHFTHDLFTTNRAWVQRVCNVLIDAGVPVQWTCSARADTVDDDLIELMARAGCNAIYFGVESGSERILREIHKAIPLEESLDALRMCTRHGITPNAGFIVGFPTEDQESLRDTLTAYERALQLGCRPTHVFAYCPFAGSAMYANLGDLQCSGHFVDIPLGGEMDQRNRQLVARDRDLYGAYFRPKLPDLIPDDSDAIFALDEFSLLVEATLAPTIALAELRGSMYDVFREWIRWIKTRNSARGVPAYRSAYGTPATFAEFVQNALAATTDAAAPVLAAARALLTHLRVAEVASTRAATKMATHRSIVLPALEQLTLETPLFTGSLVAYLAVDYDVTPALLGQPVRDFCQEDTCLVWQTMPDGAIRLLRVDRAVFDAIEILQSADTTFGQLLLQMRVADKNRFSSAEPSDMMTSIAGAVQEGLITIGTGTCAEAERSRAQTAS